MRAGAQPVPAAGAPAPPAAAAPAPYQPNQAAPPSGPPTAPWVAPYPPPPGGGYPYPGAPPPGGGYPYPGAPPPGWGPPYGGGGRLVYVELTSDDPRTRIDRVVGGARVPACFAPCQKMLETNTLYVIEGDGIRSTSQFMLPDDRPSVRLDVQAGPTSRLAGGVVLMGLGIATLYIGAVVWEFGAVQNASANSFGSSTDTRDNSRAVSIGKTMVIIGIPAALVGLYLAVTTRTSVNSSTGATFTRAPPPRRRLPIALTPRGLEF